MMIVVNALSLEGKDNTLTATHLLQPVVNALSLEGKDNCRYHSERDAGVVNALSLEGKDNLHKSFKCINKL